jgi:Mg/Co/Ni transporter MgtE
MNKSRDTQYHKLVKKLISTERTELLKSVFEPLKPVEIANILLQLKLQHQLVVLENLEREISSEVLNNLQDSPSILGDIVKQLSPDRLSDAIEDMPQDDAMNEFDMCEPHCFGGDEVIGQVIQTNVVAVIPTTENLPAVMHSVLETS